MPDDDEPAGEAAADRSPPAPPPEPPDHGGPARVAAALRVRRNAALGYGVATLATLALLSGVTGLPVRQYPPHLAAALGFVLAFALGSLLTVAVTAARAVRLVRSL